MEAEAPRVHCPRQGVVAETRARPDHLRGVTHIGMVEVHYKRGQRYLTAILDHDTSHVLYAAPGRGSGTVGPFFLLVRRRGRSRLSPVGAGAWVAQPVRAHCPNARLGQGPFPVVSRSTDALDEIRRAGQAAVAKEVKDARRAIWNTQPSPSATAQAQLAETRRTNGPLRRAYLLKEKLREVFRLSRTIRSLREKIAGAIRHGRRNVRTLNAALTGRA